MKRIHSSHVTSGEHARWPAELAVLRSLAPMAAVAQMYDQPPQPSDDDARLPTIRSARSWMTSWRRFAPMAALAEMHDNVLGLGAGDPAHRHGELRSPPSRSHRPADLLHGVLKELADQHHGVGDSERASFQTETDLDRQQIEQDVAAARARRALHLGRLSTGFVRVLWARLSQALSPRRSGLDQPLHHQPQPLEA